MLTSSAGFKEQTILEIGDNHSSANSIPPKEVVVHTIQVKSAGAGGIVVFSSPAHSAAFSAHSGLVASQQVYQRNPGPLKVL